MSFATAAEAPLPSVSSGHIERLALTSAYIPARPVDVWLPASYDGKTPHAVLYMHDGQMLFDANITWNHQEWRVDEVAGALIAAKKVRPFIVVGIHNLGAERQSEYFPQRPFEALSADVRADFYAQQRDNGERFLAAPVYSDAYLRFLVEELKPLIDQRFVTLPERRSTFIAGSSMGGLISWYALGRYPAVFGGAAAMSTHWLGGTKNDGVAFQAFKQALAQDLTPNTAKLYFDYGDHTLDQYYPHYQQHVDRMLKDKGWQAPFYQTYFDAGGDHSEASWAARLDRPLLFLLAQ